MAQVIVDPVELRRFAANLKDFNKILKDNTTRLQGRFNRLGETWRDQEHARFTAEFTQTMKVLRRFIAVSEQHIPLLLKKAEKVEEYTARGR